MPGREAHTTHHRPPALALAQQLLFWGGSVTGRNADTTDTDKTDTETLFQSPQASAPAASSSTKRALGERAAWLAHLRFCLSALNDTRLRSWRAYILLIAVREDAILRLVHHIEAHECDVETPTLLVASGGQSIVQLAAHVNHHWQRGGSQPTPPFSGRRWSRHRS